MQVSLFPVNKEQANTKNKLKIKFPFFLLTKGQGKYQQ